MKINSAEFITSVANHKDLLKDGKVEFAFCGKSNVGKSSFINFLCGQKKLAKTSSLPGRTRLVNYFLINKDFYFVDLPGYGYAKAGQNNKEMWASLLERYLIDGKQIKLVFMLVDIRHDPTELDKVMLKFLYQSQLPFKIIATKSDKIAKTKISQYIQNIAKCLSVGKDDIIAVSAETGKGIDEVLKEVEKTLNVEKENEFIKTIKAKDAKLLAKLIRGEKYQLIFNNLINKKYIQIDKEISFEINQLEQMGIVEIQNEFAKITDFGNLVISFR